MRLLLFIICISMSGSLFADGTSRPVLEAVRIHSPIKVDAVLDEPEWHNAPVATDFTQFMPNPGEPPSYQTQAWILYDDKAIYIGAKVYDDPALISRHLIERDKLFGDLETDWFGIAVDTYMDGINGFAFVVTPSGVQNDIKFSIDDEDDGWDAVWSSATAIVEDGWIVEMQIPYSALRFPDRQEQSWHLQIGRKSFVSQEESYWSPVDPAVDGFFTQAGILQGIRDIRSPVRLSATPFIAFYQENYHDKDGDPKSTWGNSFNGGMDVRYGISDAFTLDMTLIPDFGQVRSDNEVLNLSPFEVQFDENRQFFTEGIELFSKANIFYSRRVGGKPLYHDDVGDMLLPGEEITSNPGETQLYNATKISGRTSRGTGIGFFNAVTGREYAEIRNEQGDERRVLTSPLTNYNVSVIDQNLKNNSYVSLINTNVWREGSAYEANVTGTEFGLRNKTNTYSLIGNASVSQLYENGDVDAGYKYFIEFGKQSGSLIWEVARIVKNDTYDPNDFGLNFSNNEVSHQADIEYNIYQPFGRWLRMSMGLFSKIIYLHSFPDGDVPQLRDNLYNRFFINPWWSGTLRNYLRLSTWAYVQPVKGYDYFEPRMAGRFYERPSYYDIGASFGTDNRKKVIVNLTVRYLKRGEKGQHQKAIDLQPMFRLNDRVSLTYTLDVEHDADDIGYVTDSGKDDIIFGKRDIVNVLNLLQVNYVFNAHMHLHFRLRHNWTRVRYDSFHQLMPAGTLAPSTYLENEDINFNAFTIDAVYRWRFAPGSDMFLVWKNSIIAEDDTSAYSFWQNLDQLTGLPMRNSLSVKLLYYLDVARLKR